MSSSDSASLAAAAGAIWWTAVIALVLGVLVVLCVVGLVLALWSNRRKRHPFDER